MTATTPAGTLSSLHRFPVKSMLGEQLDHTTVVPSGVEGDRAWALLDVETGHVVSVKRPKRWGALFGFTATTSDAAVLVRFPDGRELPVGDPALEQALSAHLGREVRVVSEVPPGAVFEEAWERDLKNGVLPWFDLPTRMDDEEGEVVEGGQLMGDLGNLQNFGAVHLVTTSALRRLEELSPGRDADPLRFRPNLVVDTADDGFVETGWQGRTLALGDVRLQVSFTVPRCVVTTLAQGDLPQDRDVLRTVSQHNSVDCFGSGVRYPCVGVYADVVVGGRVERGQSVALLD